MHALEKISGVCTQPWLCKLEKRKVTHTGSHNATPVKEQKWNSLEEDKEEGGHICTEPQEEQMKHKLDKYKPKMNDYDQTVSRSFVNIRDQRWECLKMDADFTQFLHDRWLTLVSVCFTEEWYDVVAEVRCRSRGVVSCQWCYQGNVCPWIWDAKFLEERWRNRSVLRISNISSICQYDLTPPLTTEVHVPIVHFPRPPRSSSQL